MWILSILSQSTRLSSNTKDCACTHCVLCVTPCLANNVLLNEREDSIFTGRGAPQETTSSHLWLVSSPHPSESFRIFFFLMSAIPTLKYQEGQFYICQIVNWSAVLLCPQLVNIVFCQLFCRFFQLYTRRGRAGEAEGLSWNCTLCSRSGMELGYGC